MGLNDDAAKQHFEAVQFGEGFGGCPYLLKGLRVERPNQVWSSDITYLPIRRGFRCLVAIIDWHTRKVLSGRVSNTLEADFCVEALKEARAGALTNASSKDEADLRLR